VPLLTKPAASIDEVVGVMTAIEQALPQSDGVWWFNHLYLRVTLSVREAMSGSSAFGDATFLERLDVVFANLYFDALAADKAIPGTAPHAWRPLLSSRTAVHVHPLVTIFAVLTGEKIAGILGMILAVPVAAGIKVVLDYAYPRTTTRIELPHEEASPAKPIEVATH